MVDEHGTTQEQKQAGGKAGKAKAWVKARTNTAFEKILTFIWSRESIGGKQGKFTPPSWAAGGEQAITVLREFRPYFEENGIRISLLNDIETRWEKLEGPNYLFPFRGGKSLEHIKYGDYKEIGKEADNITDIYRALGHYRDEASVNAEIHLFENEGTIDVEVEPGKSFSQAELEKMRVEAQNQIDKLKQEEQKRELTEAEDKELKDLEEGLSKIRELKFPTLPLLAVNSKMLPFALDGRPEEVIAFGIDRMPDFKGPFTNLNHSLNLYAAANRVRADIRANIGELIAGVTNGFKKFEEAETKHKEKLDHLVLPLLGLANQKAGDVSQDLRPKMSEIRFSHTYKIIKTFRTFKIEEPIYRIIEDPNEIYRWERVRNATGNEVREKRLVAGYFNRASNHYTKRLDEVRQQLGNINITEAEAKYAIEHMQDIMKQKKKEQKENTKRAEEDIELLKSRLAAKLARSIIVAITGLIDRSGLPDTDKDAMKNSISRTDFQSQLQAQIKKMLSSTKENKEKNETDLKSLINASLVKIQAGLLPALSKIVDHINKSIAILNKKVKKIRDELEVKIVDLAAAISQAEEDITKNKSTIRRKKELQIEEDRLNFYLAEPALWPDISRFHKFDGEIELGLDENGWELEVGKVNNTTELKSVNENAAGVWVVLTDKWWHEISQNKWQMRTIKNKAGGKEIIKNKISRGIKRHGVRVVDEKFIDDLDPLDRMMFIENEWDAYRDDYRDGRYHPHSKTILDYLIAGMKGITPLKPIHLHGNNEIKKSDEENRIKYVPLYVSESENALTRFIRRRNRGGRNVFTAANGEVRPDITLDEIPEDERKVSRIYDQEIDLQEGTVPHNRTIDGVRVHVLKGQIRKGGPFNPAFDRAALGGKQPEFLHWGRMLYYETVDGINRWSENPYPHISTRGLAKYLIDLTIRRTFSFAEARKALMGKQWDYGIRHYGGPFIDDPLGDAVAPSGSPGSHGEGAMKGAKVPR